MAIKIELNDKQVEALKFAICYAIQDADLDGKLNYAFYLGEVMAKLDTARGAPLPQPIIKDILKNKVYQIRIGGKVIGSTQIPSDMTDEREIRDFVFNALHGSKNGKEERE